ncbi:hypothetical protein [Bradyrhizobium sp. SZCCHNR2009]|uniref:hypothetical protein n=1 Tax=Bradyrhizobium sp. SZCCHNR2009 TaxID=3057375 RepID=UPI0028E3226F|nr:hypothetical protein [Bradyrhizobium sp. SZCCHNR2009]
MKFFDYFYREEVSIDRDWSKSWDIFVSSWDGSDRVRQVYDHVSASRKVWIVHPEYKIAIDELPTEQKIEAVGGDPHATRSLIDHLEALCNLKETKVCFDITGMLRPQIAILVRFLKHRGVSKFDVIYSQPADYAKRERTKFSSGEVTDVKEIAGFGGINHPGAQEVLIVAPGFDAALQREVFDHKASAQRYLLFGLPSLQPDMYQQNILQAYGIDTPVPDNEASNTKRFAPAADPFSVATELSAVVSEARIKWPRSRFYIAPLGPKPQMLGAALFYLTEIATGAISLIYPVVSSHTPATSSGISKVAINTIDFALLDAITARN